MSACPRESLLDRFDEASGAHRAVLLDHVLSCARCRAALVASDPSHLFALLALKPAPPDVLEDVSAAVAAEVREDVPTRQARVRVAAWAAALLLAMLAAKALFGPLRAPTGSKLPGLTPPESAGVRAGVELLSSPGSARVVDLAVGDTQVVMIFDERLNL